MWNVKKTSVLQFYRRVTNIICLEQGLKVINDRKNFGKEKNTYFKSTLIKKGLQICCFIMPNQKENSTFL